MKHLLAHACITVACFWLYAAFVLWTDEVVWKEPDNNN